MKKCESVSKLLKTKQETTKINVILSLQLCLALWIKIIEKYQQHLSSMNVES